LSDLIFAKTLNCWNLCIGN